MTLRHGILMVAALALPGLAQAETTPWAENDGGRMRLIVLPADGEGIARAALEIEPKPGWITYWREPGGSGVPPRITGSAGLNVWAPKFPPPSILKVGDLVDIGYDRPVTFAFKMDPLKGPAKVDVFIGLCQKICIPFQASFDLEGSSEAATPEEAALVDKAEAAIAPDQGEDFHVTALDLARERLVLGLNLPVESGLVEVIATGPPGYVFTGSAEAKGKQASVTVPFSNYPAASDPQKETWQFVVKAGDKAIETEIQTED